MADADVKQLLLQVDASVELLRKNLKEGESRVASFEREVEKRMDRVDRSFLKAGTGLTGISKAITAVQSRLSGFAGSLGNVAAAIGLAFSVDAFVGMVQRALDYASSLGEVAQQLGVTTEELQVLRYAATQTGISQEQLDKALGKLRVTMGQVAAGAKAPIAALKAIGLSAEDLAGKSGGEQLALIAEGLSKIPDSAQRAAVEVGLFGKAGAALDTLLSGGKKGIDDLSNAAKRLGIVLSDEQIQKADDTADKLAALKLVLEANIAGTVADNARAILTLADALAQLVVWSGKAATAWVVFYKTQQATLAERVRDNPFMSGAIRLKAAEAASDARNDIFEVTSGGKPNPAVNRNVIWDQKLGRFVNKKPNADFGGEPDGVPGVAGMLSGGGGGRSGPSGPTQEEIEQRFRDALVRIQTERLRAELGLATEADRRLELQGKLMDLEYESQVADIKANKDYRDAQKKALIEELNKTYGRTEDGEVISNAPLIVGPRRDFDRQEAEEARALREADLRNQRDVLEASLELAETRDERKEIELRILDLADQQERTALEDQINDKTISETKREEARRRLAILDQLKASATAAVERRNEGAGATYLRDLRRESADLGESIERIQVDALEDTSRYLSESAKDALKLHGFLGDIVGDFIELAIRQQALLPLAQALFGDGGGGGGGGLFGSILSGVGSLLGGGSNPIAGGGFSSFSQVLKNNAGLSMPFGGFREGGGDVEAGKSYVVGEKRPEIFVPRISGKILAGTGGGGNSVSLGITINAPGATSETVSMIRREIQNAAPQIITAARNVTIAAANRTRLP